MTANYYKEKFIELFKEMEEEIGDCASVEIDRMDEVSFGGEIIQKSYKCRITF